MGCFNCKCCTHYQSSRDDDSPGRGEVNPHNNVHRKQILTQRSLELVSIPSHNLSLQYASLTQRGYYPDYRDKENQDSLCIRTQIQGNPNAHFFGVFDGHGHFGTQCSNFVKDRLVDSLSNDNNLLNDPAKAYNSAFVTLNHDLHKSEIDDGMSGTTGITVLVIGDTLHVANVGDSRAVIAVKKGNRIIAHDLSSDQTPFRKDECQRVKTCGARVLSVDQIEGLKDPGIEAWGEEESQGDDPPRLWAQNGMYPGTAFTRSIGDSMAEKIGVVAVPEVSTIKLTPDHVFFVVASDGVFEFLSSQAVVDMAARYTDPRDACAAIAGESYKLWLENENRTDDITIIIAQINDLSNSDVGTTCEATRDGVRQTNQETVNRASDMLAVSGSEIFRSVKSHLSDLQLPFQHSPSSNQGTAIVSSPPLTGLEVVGLSSGRRAEPAEETV